MIPNIDIIKYIYLLKEQEELEDTRLYYGVCPSYITVPHTKHIWKEFIFNDRLKLTSLFMKLIMEPGFICTFHFYEKDYDQLNALTTYLLEHKVNNLPLFYPMP